jgi:hypothetical protein
MKMCHNIILCILSLVSDSGRDFGLDIGLIDHIKTQLLITPNYRTISDFHTLEITRAHALFHPAFSSLVVAW